MHAVALVTLPTGLRRLAPALGHRAGYTSEGYADLALDATGTAYMAGLSVVSELPALLTLGLVRSWGERLPHWVTPLGGRAVRPMVALVPACSGAAWSRRTRERPR